MTTTPDIVKLVSLEIGYGYTSFVWSWILELWANILTFVENFSSKTYLFLLFITKS